MRIIRGRPSVVGVAAMSNLVLLAALIAFLRYVGPEPLFLEWLLLALCIPLSCWLALLTPLGGPAPGTLRVFIALAPINAYLWARLVTWPFRKRSMPEEQKARVSTGKPSPVTLAAVGNLVLLATLVAFMGFFPELPAVFQTAIEWLAFLLGLPLSGVLLLSWGLGVTFPEQVFAALALAPVNCYLWARLVTWPFRRQRRDAERSGEQTEA